MPKITFKDIKCYKKLIIDSDGGFLTPYIYAKVEIGKKYKSKLRKCGISNVGEGLHSMDSLDSLKKIYTFMYDKDEVIVECIIPKFSIYYSGLFCNLKSYASNRLKYIRIVE